MNGFLREEINKRGVPDLFTSLNGDKVNNLSDWEDRKKEIKTLLERECYGITPDANCEVKPEVLIESDEAVCGKAYQKRVNLTVSMPYKWDRWPSFSYRYTARPPWGGPEELVEKLTFPINVFIPKDVENPPMFIYASFSPVLGSDMPLEEIIDQGYAITSFYYQDIVPDSKDDFLAGKVLNGDSSDKSEWAAIAKWAWAYGRIMDYLETLGGFDKDKVAACGASRLGKATLWAGAQDERFSLTVPMISGTGGAALYRENKKENIAHLIDSFPHWFCGNYQKYHGKEDTLPWDSHFVMSLVAPRNLYIFSGEDDGVVDSESECLAAKAATPVYEMYGKKGLVEQDEYPKAGDEWHEGSIGYHLRKGPHCVSRHDWNALIRYRKKHNV